MLQGFFIFCACVCLFQELHWAQLDVFKALLWQHCCWRYCSQETLGDVLSAVHLTTSGHHTEKNYFDLLGRIRLILCNCTAIIKAAFYLANSKSFQMIFGSLSVGKRSVICANVVACCLPQGKFLRSFCGRWLLGLCCRWHLVALQRAEVIVNVWLMELAAE